MKYLWLLIFLTSCASDEVEFGYQKSPCACNKTEIENFRNG